MENIIVKLHRRYKDNSMDEVIDVVNSHYINLGSLTKTIEICFEESADIRTIQELMKIKEGERRSIAELEEYTGYRIKSEEIYNDELVPLF